jgi:hypothetical protein
LIQWLFPSYYMSEEPKMTTFQTIEKNISQRAYRDQIII